MNINLVSCFFVLFFPFYLSGQSKLCNCDKIKKGTFYFYPPRASESLTIFRDASVQREIKSETKDTSFWKVSWSNDCVLTLSFIRNTLPLSDEDKLFYSHQIVVKVLNVEKRYYTFKGGLDSINNASALVDTLWFSPKKRN